MVDLATMSDVSDLLRSLSPAGVAFVVCVILRKEEEQFLRVTTTVLLYTYTVLTLDTEWSGVFFRLVIHIARITPRRKSTCLSEVGRNLLKNMEIVFRGPCSCRG